MSPAPSPPDVFLAAFRADIEAGCVRPLAEYLTRFPGDDTAIADAYISHKRSGAAEPSADRIAHYKIIRELGRGGQATVYLAEDTNLHRKVALKVLTGLGPIEGDSLGRFHREAAVASKLDHPGICGVHDAGVERGIAYIAMRYVEGTTLASRIGSAKSHAAGAGGAVSFVNLDEASSASDGDAPATASSASSSQTTRRAALEVAGIIERAARALHAAHESGIVHRDIKPGNIMLTPKGEPVLLDFGLARDLDDGNPTLTRTGELFGTPAYMAPEQLMAQRIRVDRRADVWSLGVTLYEALTLRRPFEAPTREGVYQAIQFKDPVPPRKLNAAIPPDLEVVISTALEKDPDRRYSSAEAFAEDLRRVREDEPIAAKPVSALGRAWRWAKRRPARAALLVALVIGIPTIATLGGVLWAKLPDIRERDRQKTRAKVEEHLHEGFSSLSDSDPDTAIVEFEAVLRLVPDEVEALGGLALAHSIAGRDAAALAVLDGAPPSVASSVGLQFVRIRALENSGRRPESRALGMDVDGLELGSASDFFLGAYVELTNAYHSPGSRVNALAYANRAVDLSPRPRLLYYAYRVHCAGNVKDRAAVEEGCAVIVRLWPDQPMAWRGRSNALWAIGLKEQALAAAQRSLELRTSANSLNLVGYQLAKMGRFQEAVPALERAVALAPRFGRAWNNLGWVLNNLGQSDRAIEIRRKAVAAVPRDSWAWANLGRDLYARGRSEDRAEAEAACRKSIEIMPEQAGAWFGLGLVFKGERRAEDAADAFRKSLQILDNVAALNPDDHGSWEQLVQVHVYLGDFDSAARCLSEAVRTDPSCTPCQKAQANTHRVAGVGAQLRRILSRAESAPTDVENRVDILAFCRAYETWDEEAELWRLTFEQAPEVERNLEEGNRLLAAQAAARAGTDTGSRPTDGAARKRWRDQALSWLEVDIRARRAEVDEGSMDAEDLAHAMKMLLDDKGLAPVRELNGAALPSDERDRWARLWKEVEALSNPGR